MSYLTIWRFTRGEDSVSEIPKSSFDSEQCYDAYRPIYTFSFYIHIERDIHILYILLPIAIFLLIRLC